MDTENYGHEGRSECQITLSREIIRANGLDEDKYVERVKTEVEREYPCYHVYVSVADSGHEEFFLDEKPCLSLEYFVLNLELWDEFPKAK